MRPIKTLITTMLVAGLASVSYARVPARDAAEPIIGHEAASAAVQEPKPAEPKAPKQAPEAKPPKAEKQAPAAKHKEKADKDQKKDKKQAKAEQKDQKAGGKGGRIPDKDFKAHFGQSHKFRAKQVIRTTTIVPNQTRFAYSGYTFVFLEPWPAGWLLDDDLYIDYMDGGYFLMDPFHPGIQVGLSVVF